VKRTITGLALAALAALAAGCGGDDALSKADYVKQGNKICADFETSIAKDAKKVLAGLRSEKDLTPDKARAFFDTALPKFDAAVEDLDDLAPPEGDEDKVQAIIDAGKADSKNIAKAKKDDQAIRALLLNVGGAGATPKFAKTVKAYGLTKCGS